MDLSKDDIRRLAELAEELGTKISVNVAGERDELAGEHGDYIADIVTLNSVINTLANLMAIKISCERGDEVSNHIEEVTSKLHELVAELLGKKGPKTIFIKMERPEGVDEKASEE